MKKLSLLLVFIMVLSIGSTGVSAKEKDKIKTEDEKLVEMGVPSELIEIMPKEQKKDILKQKMEFKSYKKVTMEDLESMQDIDSEDLISIRGTIPTSDLDFYISTYYQYPYNSSEKKVRIYANYDWHVVPNFTLTDPYGIAWDDDIWRPVDNTSMTYTYWKLENGTVKSESDSALSYSATTGCGWDTDIKYAYGLLYVVDNYGWGAITLEAKDPSDSGTTQIHANYSHVHGVGGIGLSFKAISVSYSGGAAHDGRGTYKTFSY